MKMTTMMAAVLASTALVAATPKEYLDAGDYANFVLTANLSKDAKTFVTLENARPVFEASLAITNYQKAAYAAGVAYELGDKSLFTELFSERIPTTIEDSFSKIPSEWTMATLNKEKFSVKWTNPAGVEKLLELSLNELEPDLMLAFFKRMKAAGNYNIASLAFWTAVDDAKGIKGGLNKHINAEWQEFFASFTTSELHGMKYPNSYTTLLSYFRRLDYMAHDASEPNFTKAWSPEAWKRAVVTNGNIISTATDKYYNDALTITMNNSIKVSSRIRAAAILDKRVRTKEASSSIFGYVLENGTWVEKADLAFYLNDADKIIDAFKTVGTDATPEQFNKLIPIINGLDYKYRSAEVLDILKNINSKYTLKLYDDRDTWEPILSKIRAMIDAR